MIGLSWRWIVLQALAPPVAGLLAAYPFWRKEQAIFGNLAGTAIIFSAAFALILREHTEVDRVVRACLDQGFTCWPDPGAFTRFAVYAFIGLFEVIALFTISLRVEATRRRRGYDPEWR